MAGGGGEGSVRSQIELPTRTKTNHRSGKNWRLIEDPILCEQKDTIDRIYRIEGFLAGLHDIKYDQFVDPEVVDPRLPKEQYLAHEKSNYIILLDEYKEIDEVDSCLYSNHKSTCVKIENLTKYHNKKSLLNLCQRFGEVRSLKFSTKMHDGSKIPIFAIVKFVKSKSAIMCMFSLNKFRHHGIVMKAMIDYSDQPQQEDTCQNSPLLNKKNNSLSLQNFKEDIFDFDAKKLNHSFILNPENTSLFNSYQNNYIVPSDFRVLDFIFNNKGSLERHFDLGFAPEPKKQKNFSDPPSFLSELQSPPPDVDFSNVSANEKKEDFAQKLIEKLYDELLKSSKLFIMRSILLPRLRSIIKNYSSVSQNVNQLASTSNNESLNLQTSELNSSTNSLFSEIVKRKSEIPSFFGSFDPQAPSREIIRHNKFDEDLTNALENDEDDEIDLVPIKIKQITKKRPRMQVNSEDNIFLLNNKAKPTFKLKKHLHSEKYKSSSNFNFPFDSKKLRSIQRSSLMKNKKSENFLDDNYTKFSDAADDIYYSSQSDDYFEEKPLRKIMTRRKLTDKNKYENDLDCLYLNNEEELNEDCIFDSEDWEMLEEIFSPNEFNMILHSIHKRRQTEGEYVDLYDPLKLHTLNQYFREQMLDRTKDLLGINSFLQTREEELNNIGIMTINKTYQRDHRSSFRKLTPIADMNLKYNKSLTTKDSILKFGLSKIDLIGLFATEKINPNELLIEYCGEIIRTSVAERREEKVYQAQSSYFFQLTDFAIIDATHVGNNARFINHSCNPNSFAKIIQINGVKHVGLYSKKEIVPGEEITYDYKFPYEDNKIPCKCGSYNCRQYLN